MSLISKSARVLANHRSSTDARTDARSDGERNLCRDSDAHVGAAERGRGCTLGKFKETCRNFKEGRKRMSEPKMGPTEFAAEVERLKAEKTFPSLETLLAAIAKVRAEFAPRILAARLAKKERGAR